MQDNNNKLVVKANDIVEAGYELTTNEQRLILLALSKIPPMKEVVETSYVVTASEFADSFKNIHPKTAYRDLKAAANKIYDRTILIKLSNQNQTAKVRWTTYVIVDDDFPYDKVDGNNEPFNAVVIGFSPQILPYLTNLKKEFTRYLQSDISEIRGSYTIRFYELMVQYEKIGERTITVEDLRFMLNLQNKYPLFGDIKRWVLNPSIKEINEKTPMIAEWQPILRGKRVKAIKLTFKRRVIIDSKATQINSFDGLTDAQLSRITHSKKFIDDYGSLVSPGNPANQSSSVWISHMVKWIKKDPSNFNKRPVKEYLDDEQSPRFG